MGRTRGKCSVGGCGRPHFGKGLCGMHYVRLRRYGDLDFRKKIPFGAQDWLRDNVNHTGDACLIWPFARTAATGYGVVELNGRQTSLQYAMCTLAHGKAPSTKHQAAHSCGNGHKACGNPRHLRWATATENAADALLHGTRARGERQGASKLSEHDVRTIRRRATRETQRHIAADYGVAQGHISRIVQRRAWGWLE